MGGNADGYIKIKTKIDNSQIDKDVQRLEDKIKKLQESNADSSKQEDGLRREIAQYEEMTAKAEEYRQKIKQLKQEKKDISANFGGMIPESQLGTINSLNNQISSLRSKYASITTEIDKQAPRVSKVYDKLEKIKAKQTENNSKIKQFNKEIKSINTNNLQKNLNNIGNNISNQIGKIGRMGLAIVGIQSAWSLVHSAIGMVSQYNQQVSTDFEYMRYVIAQAILPVVQTLIKLLYTALSYINAITSAWFGINLFGNASAKSFQKMSTSAGQTAKSAKEIKKSLQGFDEMNILQDSSSGGSDSGGGGGGGFTAPSMDLSLVQQDIPAWLQWIIDNKDIILSVLAGIVAGLVAIKLGLDPIRAIGLGTLVAGIVYTIQSLISYLQDPSWENFGKIIQGVGVAIIGLGVLIGNIPLAIAGAVVLIVGTIIKYWDQIKSFFQNGIDWLTNQSDFVHAMFGDTIGNIYDIAVEKLQMVLDIFDNVFTAIKGIFDGLIMFIKGVFSGDWQMAWEGIKKIFSSIWEGIKGIVVSVWNFINNLAVKVAESVGNVISSVFKAIVNSVLRTIESVLNSPINAINGLIGVINKVPGINLGRLSTFNLPRLARGGVVSQPTQAIIGEAGAEMIMPLENNTKYLDLLADKILSKMGGKNGVVNVYLDGRLIQRQMSKREQELAFAKNGG